MPKISAEKITAGQSPQRRMTAVVTLRNANSSVTGATSTTETNIVSACTGVIAKRSAVFASPFSPAPSKSCEMRFAGMFIKTLTARPAKTSKTLFSTPFFSTSTVSESFLFPKNRKNVNGSTMDKNDAMDEIR